MSYQPDGCAKLMIAAFGVMAIIVYINIEKTKTLFSVDRRVDTEASAKAQKPKNWASWADHNSMDGTAEAGVTTGALFADSLGDQKPELGIQCLKSTMTVFVEPHVSAHPELGSFESYTIRYKLNDGKPITGSAREGTNGTTLFIGGPAMAKKLLGAYMFTFEFTPFRSSAVTLRFDTANLDAALGDVRKACPKAGL